MIDLLLHVGAVASFLGAILYVYRSGVAKDAARRETRPGRLFRAIEHYEEALGYTGTAMVFLALSGLLTALAG